MDGLTLANRERQMPKRRNPRLDKKRLKMALLRAFSIFSQALELLVKIVAIIIGGHQLNWW